MPSYFTAKDERMYQHIRDSGLSKAAAAATVNKYRAKQKAKRGKRTKRSR